jgi:hypothetical protein
MTAITVTVKVSEELAHQLKTVPDIDQFASEAFAAKMKLDHTKMLEEQYSMYDAETLFGKSEPIPLDVMKDIQTGAGQPGNDEGYMSAEDFRAVRRAERAEARARDEARQIA